MRRSTPKLMADAPEYNHQGGCNTCPMDPICQRRLELSRSAPVLCEIPDQFDVLAMEAEGFPFVVMELEAA